MSEPVAHRSVLPDETLRWLAPEPGCVVVDATLGAGGHAESILEAIGTGGRLIGIDRDPHALEIARRRLERYGAAFVPVRGDHHDLVRLLEDAGVESVDRILFDLGVSSMQLDDPSRGFSFRVDGPLDMRMDPDHGPTAAELIAGASERELREILWRYGEERRARAIAGAIVRERERNPIRSTRQLAALVERTLGPAARKWRIHPATRSFLAFRVATNREITGLESLIAESIELLRVGGRLVAISFHSIEDRAVKHALKSLARRCTCPPSMPVCGCGKHDLVRILTPKPIGPTDEEVERNPRARSAKLRAAERI